ncbi:MAG: CHAD domain-containing protein [Psychrosphaera sp.]|nr:CHAD domain-containing protein [Psychrosphaera sp.]
MLKPSLKRLLALVTLTLLVTACTSKEEQIQKAVDQQARATAAALQQLEKALDDKRIRNTTILSQYATTLKAKKPELGALIDHLAKDATVQGPLYSNLVLRFDQAKNNAKAFADPNQRINELQAISEGAQLSLFNDALSDPINVLADMSDGTLPRVNAISRESEVSANNAQGGPGSQLVGNPNYGNWQTGSGGTSFWAWYGMYSMFSNVMGYNRYNYGGWGQNRGYSYYSDYGRNRYSSPKQRQKQQNLHSKTKKSFAARGKSFSGPYSKRRVGSSSLSRASHTPTKRSSFAKKSAFSSNSGSVRSGSSRTSRGRSRGK